MDKVAVSAQVKQADNWHPDTSVEGEPSGSQWDRMRWARGEIRKLREAVAQERAWREDLEAEAERLAAEVARLRPYRDAVHSAHNGYDPEMVAAGAAHEPASPADAIRELVEEATALADVAVHLIERRANDVAAENVRLEADRAALIEVARRIPVGYVTPAINATTGEPDEETSLVRTADMDALTEACRRVPPALRAEIEAGEEPAGGE